MKRLMTYLLVILLNLSLINDSQAKVGYKTLISLGSIITLVQALRINSIFRAQKEIKTLIDCSDNEAGDLLMHFVAKNGYLFGNAQEKQIFWEHISKISSSKGQKSIALSIGLAEKRKNDLLMLKQSGLTAAMLLGAFLISNIVQA